MNNPTRAALAVTAGLSLAVTSGGPALAANTTSTEQQSLYEAVQGGVEGLFDSIQSWLDERYGNTDEPTTAPSPTSTGPLPQGTSTPIPEPSESTPDEADPTTPPAVEPTPQPTRTGGPLTGEAPAPTPSATETPTTAPSAEPTTDPTTAPTEPAEDPAENETSWQDDLRGTIDGWIGKWTDRDDGPGSEDPAPAPTDDPSDGVDVSPEVQAVVDGHNAHRESRGLAPLTLHPEITTVAQNWSEEMAANGDLTHNPDYAEQLPGDVVASAENIAQLPADSTPEDAVEGWVNSPGHERNIVGGYTHLGVGIATTDDGDTYYTVNFADIPEDREYPPAEEFPIDQESTDENTTGAAPIGSTPDGTGGTGGAVGEQLNVPFTNAAGVSSEYHAFVPEGDEPKGLIFWADGTGAHGYEHPEQEYLIGGPDGLAAVAAERGYILVVPLAPEGGCYNCWYEGDTAAKAQWASDLMTQIKAEHNIDQNKIVLGGYSSGAQLTTWTFGPTHAEEQGVDLLLPMAYGTPGDLSGISEDYAASTWVVFNTGTNDTNGRGGGAYAAAQAGREAYEAAGFNVEWEESDATHDRGGEFGRFVADNIDQHLSS